MATQQASLDIDYLRQWIGRTETVYDIVTPRLCHAFYATFDIQGVRPAEGDIAPALIHWCLAPSIAPTSALGADGHAMRGGFLPPVPLRRRMWAGGRLEMQDAVKVGDHVTRTSCVTDVVLKVGKSGGLCFVTVEHEVATERGVALIERQDIVHRDIDVGSFRRPVPLSATSTKNPRWRRVYAMSPALLFRYSALTFNAHRIHYDRDYCAIAEGYPDLVVHGPLQATLLCAFAMENHDDLQPQTFEFRSSRALFDQSPFSLNADVAGTTLNLWIADSDGAETMTAVASW